MVQLATVVQVGAGVAAIATGNPALGASLIASGAATERQAAATQEEQKAARARQAISDIQARRARVQAIRKARIARAGIVAAGEATGTGASTGVAGGTGSVQSQLAGGLAVSQGIQQLGQRSTTALNKAATARQQATIFQAAAGIGYKAADVRGEYETIFGK